MSLATELFTAKKRIENKNNWCSTDYTREHRMCALASLGMTFACGKHHTPAMDALHDACVDLYGRTVLVTNETLGHAAIMQAFNRAIDEAQKTPYVVSRELVAA